MHFWIEIVFVKEGYFSGHPQLFDLSITLKKSITNKEKNQQVGGGLCKFWWKLIYRILVCCMSIISQKVVVLIWAYCILIILQELSEQYKMRSFPSAYFVIKTVYAELSSRKRFHLEEFRYYKNSSFSSNSATFIFKKNHTIAWLFYALLMMAREWMIFIKYPLWAERY